MTPFGKQLFLAKSEAEAKKLLGITTDSFADEAGNIWVVPTDSKAFITPAQAKFGTRSLSFDSASATLQTATPLTFGGDPFEITFWLYIGAVLGNFFRALGTTKSFGLSRELVAGVGEADARSSLFFKSGTTSLSINSSTPRWTYGANNKWTLIKLEYDGSNSLKIYQNNSLKKTVSITVPREPRRIIFGGCGGYIDEFRILDGIYEHTANCAVPTTAYKCSDYPNNTISLMHFE